MANEKINGGPAFPRPMGSALDESGVVKYNESQRGMSLLDYYAGKALSAIRSRNPRVFDHTKQPKSIRYLTSKEVAEMAWEDAIAMIEEKNKRNI
jgi:hypothetical protein